VILPEPLRASRLSSTTLLRIRVGVGRLATMPLALPEARRVRQAWRVAVAVSTDRKAWASMARTVQRRQEVQPRTWCSSRAVSSLPPAKDSSIFQHSLLDVAGLIDDQNRTRVARVLGDVVAQVVPDSVLIPDRLRQQPLHPAWVGLAGVLGDRPAVPAGQLSQQTRQERRDPTPRLHPPEPRPDPQHQLSELALPPIHRCEAYAGGRSHRRNVVSLHKP
jgi:hypothetical protein